MKCDFQVGDEVVCVSTEVFPGGGWCKSMPKPEVGCVYHVAEVVPVTMIEGLALRIAGAPEGWFIAVVLKEMPTCTNCPASNGMPHIWFRKVERRGTESGMEILRKALDDVKGKTKVDA